MSPRVRLLTGAVATLTFLAIGVGLLSEGQKGWGAVLLAVGAFRAAWLVKEWAPWDDEDRG